MSSTSVLSPAFIREPIREAPRLERQSSIIIYHPGDDPYVLFVLPSYGFIPQSDPSELQFGFHLGTVLDACYIISSNRAGYLSLKEGGVVDGDIDGFLKPGSYTYNLYDGSVNYPIVRDFNAWKPSQPPPRWKIHPIVPPSVPLHPDETQNNTASKGSQVKMLNRGCIITKVTCGLTPSHLIPQAHHAWFIHYGLFDLAEDDSGVTTVNSISNQIMILSVLNGEGLDRSLFTFCPVNGEWVTCVLKPVASQFAHDFHLRKVDIPARIRPTYIWSRFAWNIIQLSKSAAPSDEDFINQVAVCPQLSAKLTKGQKSNSRPGAPELPKPSLAHSSSPKDQMEDQERTFSSDSDSAGSCEAWKLAKTPDLCDWSLERIARIKETDKKIQRQMLASENPDVVPPEYSSIGLYPGYSQTYETIWEYLKQNPSVRDSGGARIGNMDDVELEEF